ncbi:chaplin family protein [Streptomyces sp. NPDC088785]|uniref:chaplin n=1 Tax=Streptomyces sp. NPDC088785 TaxID=3365897 RepID=UPI0038256E31
MRQVTRKGLITVAAATGVLAVTGGYAHADSGANGSASGSPGVASGNNVQVPVEVPVNVCGNTVNVIGLLNPAIGNDCGNTTPHDGGYGDESGGGHHGHQPSGGGAHAGGHTGGSPGVGSGNHVQVPIEVPVNVCGNSVGVGSLGNLVTGNDCANPGSEHVTPPATPHTPGKPHQPGTPGKPGEAVKPATRAIHSTPDSPHAPQTRSVARPQGESHLAMTGSSLPVGATGALAAGALLGGAVLYRRSRTGA